MRFALISDTHIGNPRPGYFHQEPLADYEPLFRTLKEFCREQKIDLLCHAGDLIDDGSREQMQLAAQLFEKFPCQLCCTPGNHDLLNQKSAEWMTELLPDFFPEGTVDYTIVKGGLRIDFLTTNWGGKLRFWDGVNQNPYFSQEQIGLLDQGPQDLPRILVTHSPACGLPEVQTGFPEVYHAPAPEFEQQLLQICEKKKISMILGGHNHMNLGIPCKPAAKLTVSSFREMPFELKLIEFNGETLSVKTCSLADTAGIHLPYDYNKTHVQGRACDRSFTIPVI